jgi:hypothetical protein
LVFTELEALKVNFFLQDILNSSPVLGFLPTLSGDSFIKKTPKLEILMLLTGGFLIIEIKLSKNALLKVNEKRALEVIFRAISFFPRLTII